MQETNILEVPDKIQSTQNQILQINSKTNKEKQNQQPIVTQIIEQTNLASKQIHLPQHKNQVIQQKSIQNVDNTKQEPILKKQGQIINEQKIFEQVKKQAGDDINLLSVVQAPTKTNQIKSQNNIELLQNQVTKWEVKFIEQKFEIKQIKQQLQKIEQKQKKNQQAQKIDVKDDLRSQDLQQEKNDGDNEQLQQYRMQLLQKTKQLKQTQQQQRIKQLQKKIRQIQQHIQELEIEMNKKQKKIENEQKKEVEVVNVRKKKPKITRQDFNRIKEDNLKRLVIQIQQNKKGIKMQISPEQQQQQKKMKQQKQRNKKIPQNLHLLDKKIQISRNIYSFTVPPLTKQQLQQKKNYQPSYQQINNTTQKIKVKNQIQLEKQRLQQQVKQLKRKILQLQRKSQNISKYQSHPEQRIPTNQLNMSKIKLKDIFWHSDQKPEFLQQPIIQNNQRQQKIPSILQNSNKKFSIRQKKKNSEYLSQSKDLSQLQSKQPYTQTKRKQLISSQTRYIAQSPKIIKLQNMKFPTLPNGPLPYHTSKQLIQLGKQTLRIFGIKVDQNHILNIKKFKNCVYFNLDIYNIVWYYTGKFYIGGWKNYPNQGQKQGFGIQFVPEKYLYEGEFKNGRRSGAGTIIYQNGDKYSGDWLQGLRNGNGRWEQANGLIYDGQWVLSRRQGFGKLIISKNQIYEGMFLRNLKNGYGKQFFKNQDSYQGQYMMGKFCGKGCYKWANGAIYQGQFYNGCRNGHGSWKSASISPCDSYEGQYINDKKCGKGKYIWQNGSSYQGEFFNDLKHGEGILRFAGGKVLRAIWENGVAKKKLYCQQQQLYKQSKKPPRKQSNQKNEQDGNQNKFRISSKSINKFEQKPKSQFLKESPYRKMQHNNMLRVGDL